MKKPSLEPMTIEHWRALMPSMPVPCRVKALAMVLEDEVLALGGIAFTPSPIMFLDVTDEARKYPVTLYRGARRVMDWAREIGGVSAVRDDEEPSSTRFLTHLGFRDDGVFWRFGNVWH